MTVEERNDIVLARLNMARNMAWRAMRRFKHARHDMSLEDWEQESRLALLLAAPECMVSEGILWRGGYQRLIRRVLGTGKNRTAHSPFVQYDEDTDEPTECNKQLALFEAAHDVQKLINHVPATTGMRDALHVTLAERVLTKRHANRKQMWVKRAREKIGHTT